MRESLAAMKALLTVEEGGGGEGEGEGEGEGGGEEEESIEIDGEGEGEEENEDEEEAVERGREIEMKMEDDSDEEDDERKHKDEVDDGVAVEGSRPLPTDSINRTDEEASNMAQKSVAKLTRHNIHNVQERIQALEVESKHKSKFKLKLKTVLKENDSVNRNKSGQHKWNGNSNINMNGNMNYYDGQKVDSEEIHIVIVPRAPVKVNTSHDVHNRSNPLIPHDKSLISIKNGMKFTECSSHLEACSAGMIRLRALISKDEVDLTLVIHEPEIWTRLETIINHESICYFIFFFMHRSRTKKYFLPFLTRNLVILSVKKFIFIYL